MLKQRLVGALILVALGVIFWPIIFVQPGEGGADEIQPLPQRPGVTDAPVEPPDAVGLRGSPEAAAAQIQQAQEEMISMQQPGSLDDVLSTAADNPAIALKETEPVAPALPPQAPRATTRDTSPEPLEMDADGVPVAWILQIVSVSSAEKAEALRERLVALNYKAYVTQVQSNGRTLHRVYLGPKFERAVLEKLQPGIDAELDVKSVVRRYVP